MVNVLSNCAKLNTSLALTVNVNVLSNVVVSPSNVVRGPVLNKYNESAFAPSADISNAVAASPPSLIVSGASYVSSALLPSIRGISGLRLNVVDPRNPSCSYCLAFPTRSPVDNRLMPGGNTLGVPLGFSDTRL